MDDLIIRTDERDDATKEYSDAMKTRTSEIKRAMLSTQNKSFTFYYGDCNVTECYPTQSHHLLTIVFCKIEAHL